MDLVKGLRQKLGMSIIWITHDLGVVAELAHRVVVMYAGNVIEDLPARELYSGPRHPYTIGLLSSLPRMQRRKKEETLSTIPGTPPMLWQEPVECPFRPRCQYAVEACAQKPPLLEVSPGHRAACWIDPDTRRLRS
jgi:oligopeptide/dipeptide ABC transporter ATP-binding protein